jgi:hypothetical protein
VDWGWLFQYADPDLDWGYALITLLVRFIGVFVVMLSMQVALQVAARAVKVIERRREAAAAGPPAPLAVMKSGDLPEPALDEATVAAIGIALALESGRPPLTARRPTSPWALAGRVQQMGRLPRR